MRKLQAHVFTHPIQAYGFQVQWKPLNVITLELPQSDNITRMITLTDGLYLLMLSKRDICNVISFSGFNFTYLIWPNPTIVITL